MLKTKGIYDGTNVILSEPLPLPPNSAVEVLILELSTDAEAVYWRKLLETGLIKEIRSRSARDTTYEPVHAVGEPVSCTIIKERR